MFERGVMTVFSPIPRAVNAVGTNVSDIYHGYVDMRREVTENLRLRDRVAELTAENLTLRRSNSDLARMRALLGYSEEFSMPTVLANVIMLDTAGSFKSAILDRGEKHGIELNDPVVNASGLVGRVVLRTDSLAKVQLIIDANSSVGVLFERTRRQGILRGVGDGTLRMSYVPSLTDVKPGDRIVTAGIDGIYPKGIPVATVVEVEEGKDLFKSVRCVPMADFSSIEELIILRTQKIEPQVVRYAT